VLHFERVRYADDRPFISGKKLDPAAQCPDLKREDIKVHYTWSLKKIPSSHRGRPSSPKSNFGLSARCPNSRSANWRTVMLVHGVTYLDDGRAIERKSHIRGESIEFVISWESTLNMAFDAA